MLQLHMQLIIDLVTIIDKFCIQRINIKFLFPLRTQIGTLETNKKKPKVLY
jgi:hypothetical protein